jgi:ABC-type transport system involved in cytochrome bd biosynthesis fused ATPase/permease subunit
MIYLFALDWRLAMVSILPLPGFFLFFTRAVQGQRHNMQEFVAGMARIDNAVVEFVNGMPVVKAFWRRQGPGLTARLSMPLPTPLSVSPARWWGRWPMPTP